MQITRLAARTFASVAAVAVVAGGAGCGSSPFEAPAAVLDGALHLSATPVTLQNGIVSVKAVLRNGTFDTYAGEFSASCPPSEPLVLLAYRAGAATPSWRYDRVRVDACNLLGIDIQLAPGTEKGLQVGASTQLILGDSLPAGTYRLTVSGMHLSPALSGEIEVGSLQLAK